MGIDIEFYVRTPNPLTAEDVERLSETIADRFDGRFSASRYFRGLSLCHDGLLHMHTLDRFFSEGYQRGNPLPWILLAEFFEATIPGCEIYYFGDCYDEEDALKRPWTKEDREKLKLLYFTTGNAPYYDSFKARSA